MLYRASYKSIAFCMTPTQNKQLNIIISLLIVIGMGFFFKFYSEFGRQWFNNSVAAIFYEVFWCLFVYLFLKGRRAIIQISVGVFIITCILEFLQLWHPPFLQQMRSTLVGRLILGTTFSWWDFFYYTLGCILGWFWLKQLDKSSAKEYQS